MKTLLLTAFLLAFGLASALNAANWTVEWDTPPPGHGTLEYVVQEKQADDSWLDKATTSATVVTFTSLPAAGTEFRLLIRNVNTGLESIDPNIVVPVAPDLPPPTSLNFRLKVALLDPGSSGTIARAIDPYFRWRILANQRSYRPAIVQLC